jgi:hypothetical protein
LIGFFKPMCEEGKMHNLNGSFKASKCKHFFNINSYFCFKSGSMTNMDDCRDD